MQDFKYYSYSNDSEKENKNRIESKVTFFNQNKIPDNILQQLLTATTCFQVEFIFANNMQYDLKKHCQLNPWLQTKWQNLLAGSVTEFNNFFMRPDREEPVIAPVTFKQQPGLTNFNLLYSYYLHLDGFGYVNTDPVKAKEKLEVAEATGSIHAMFALLQMDIGAFQNNELLMQSSEGIEKNPAVIRAKNMVTKFGAAGEICLADVYLCLVEKCLSNRDKGYCLAQARECLISADKNQHNEISRAAIFNLSFGQGIRDFNIYRINTPKEGIALLDKQVKLLIEQAKDNSHNKCHKPKTFVL